MSPLRPGLALAVALSLGFAAPAVASTYYVAPTGNDSAVGSSAAPWATLQKAVDTVGGGDTVLIAPGTYDSFTDTRYHGTGARLTAKNQSKPPVIHGANLYGDAYLTLDHLTIDRVVTMGTHPTNKTQFAHNLTFSNDTFPSSWGQTCLELDDGTYNVTIQRNKLSNCYTGVLGPGDGIADPAARPMTKNIKVLNNTMQHLTFAGMEIGNWNDSVIDGNVIRDVHDPNGVLHNDAIHVMGNSHRLKIRNNTLDDSVQMLFTENYLGANDGLTVTGNVITGGWAYSVQLSGTSNITFSNNTVWKSTYGVIFSAGASGTWAHNIIDRYVPGDGSGTMADSGYNLIGTLVGGFPTVTDLVGVDPMFVGPANGDYHLKTGSPALAIAAGALLPAGTTVAPAPAPTGYAAAILGTSGLASYWRLGETSGTWALDQTNADPGSRGSDVGTGAAGALAGDSDKAMSFAGTSSTDDSISLGDKYDFAGKAPFTVEAWVNPSIVDGTTRRIFSKLGASGGGWDLFLNSYNLAVQRWDDNGADSVAVAPLAVGKWSYVVATYDGTKLSLYVNAAPPAGVFGFLNPAPSLRSIPDTDSVLRIGTRSDGYGPFAGSIDEAAIYTRELTPTEIASHYRAGI